MAGPKLGASDVLQRERQVVVAAIRGVRGGCAPRGCRAGHAVRAQQQQQHCRCRHARRRRRRPAPQQRAAARPRRPHLCSWCAALPLLLRCVSRSLAQLTSEPWHALLPASCCRRIFRGGRAGQPGLCRRLQTLHHPRCAPPRRPHHTHTLLCLALRRRLLNDERTWALGIDHVLWACRCVMACAEFCDGGTLRSFIDEGRLFDAQRPLAPAPDAADGGAATPPVRWVSAPQQPHTGSACARRAVPFTAVCVPLSSLLASLRFRCRCCSWRRTWRRAWRTCTLAASCTAT